MAMSTQIWDNGSALMAQNLLVDQVQVFDVGPPVTVGFEVTRSVTPVSEDPIPGLVQSVTLESAVDGRVTQSYSIKVARSVELEPGQAVTVFSCHAQPDLVGKTLLVDEVSRNGLALIRKATASEFITVNQEGKEGLS